MRAAIERRVEDLERAAAPGPEETIENLIAELVARYATGGPDENSAAVRIEWYVDALSDLPAWAVKEALRRWRRGQCGPHKYDFAPAEATLRQIVEGIAIAARGQCIGLQRLLEAEPIEELSEEQRGENLKRFSKIMTDLVAEMQAKDLDEAVPEVNGAGPKSQPAEQMVEAQQDSSREQESKNGD